MVYRIESFPFSFPASVAPIASFPDPDFATGPHQLPSAENVRKAGYMELHDELNHGLEASTGFYRDSRLPIRALALRISYGCGSKIGTQNGILVNGTKD